MEAENMIMNSRPMPTSITMKPNSMYVHVQCATLCTSLMDGLGTPLKR